MKLDLVLESEILLPTEDLAWAHGIHVMARADLLVDRCCDGCGLTAADHLHMQRGSKTGPAVGRGVAHVYIPPPVEREIVAEMHMLDSVNTWCSRQVGTS